MKIVEHFEVPYYQYLNESGEFLTEIPEIAEKTEELLKLYRLMTLVRVMDTKAIAMQRTGNLGTYPSTRGQEAVFVGIGYAMNADDVYVPYYRDIGTLIQREVPLTNILLYWGGDERGNDFGPDNKDFPYSVPVGSQPLHAAGIAYATKYFQEKRAVLCMCGDGATSQGDFYEAMNVAGIWKLPVVFVVCNNQWAISVPRSRQTEAHTLAQKAIAAGFEGEQVDGNDIIAVVDRTRAALQKARDNNHPSLLEMICYRQQDHTTADDARRYEPAGLREEEWKKEPISRLKNYLETKKIWSASDEEKLQAECAQNVNDTVKTFASIKPQPLTDMFDYLYAKLPGIYEEQRSQLTSAEK